MDREQMRYSRLANITKILNTKLELCEVLQRVTAAISEEIVQCSSVGVFLPQEDGTFKGYAGKPDNMNGETLDTQIIDPEIDLLAKEVIDTKKTIYIPDTSKDKRPYPRAVEAFKIKSILALPILFEQDLFGLVFLFNYGTPMNLTDSEIQSVEAYVNMAAVAMRNANNLTQKENLIDQKQLLLNVTRDLSMCSSLEESLEKCFFYIEKILQSKNIAAHFLDPFEKTTIRLTKLSMNCDWTEAEWMKNLNNTSKDKNYTDMIQEVTKTKKIIHLPSFDLKGLLMIPLVSMGKVLGVIAVVHLGGEAPNYEDSQIQLVQSIVDATAPTFSNLLYMDQLESMVKERTRELASANEMVTSVIESITDGFFTLNKDWEFTYINEHQYLPQGKKANDVLGINMWEIFMENVGMDIYRELHRSMSQRITVNFEMLSPYNNNWYEVVAYPFDDGICCLLKDITEKKEYEKELKRLSNLDLIGQMAAGISHEIRNPMTTVKGFLQLIKKEEDFEKHKDYLNIMIEELDRANSIITEFLSMGNTRTSDLKMLDLNEVIHDIIPLIEVDASNQNKFVEFHTQDIPKLFLNRNEIRQLLINLYRNGLEAMCAGKALSISTYKEDENTVVLAVQDQGVGIQPEVLEKLGTPFYTTKDNGTGLGLGICYAIAARHNANIEIQTGSKGTTFIVKFKI
ncbi:ATP-binding protein [Bacillus sp. Cr_A10]|uniref:ATP-binding protein n=1 Tax=Bacillus sp. Cr_A10 TaxID=3033993 RepID=UPI0023DACB3A|nr:ATP-binding protein [Bacillus sp. Cr_A10]MDF2067823.1 ATP-binding protein [Bacillus sp. Cr_A10]